MNNRNNDNTSFVHHADTQTGYSMVVVLPPKGGVEKYAFAELRKSVFEIGMRNTNVQYMGPSVELPAPTPAAVRTGRRVPPF